MERKNFLKAIALLPFVGASMKLNAFHQITDTLSETEKMPVLFLGHGNPLNALADNRFTKGFQQTARELPTPTAILCISAHWETKGTFVTATEHPQTIHDFGGFPKALFDFQYPAPGHPALAKEAQKIIKSAQVGLNTEWGLDHGCWTVIKHMYPDANIPVIEMSIDYTKPPEYHYALAKELSSLRRKGVLIIGSGNSVHNLGLADWDNMMTEGFAFDWAIEANDTIKKLIINGDHKKLIDFDKQGQAFKLAVPSMEHYLPLLYTLGLQEKNEKPTLFNDSIVAGSLNMLSVKIDKA